MSDIESTRQRLRNWGMCYRDRSRVGTSPLYRLIKANNPQEYGPARPGARLDMRDADAVNTAVLKIDKEGRELLFGYYLWGVPDYRLARMTGNFLSTCRQLINDAEIKVGRLLDNALQTH